MKYLILASIFFSLIACQDADQYELLPECIKEMVDNPEIEVSKIGIPNDKDLFEEEVYWIMIKGQTFGYQVNSECERAGCYLWCGMTSQHEVDSMFDQGWTVVWED